MKLNAKDLASGLFLVLLAAVGLWLNQDHALGSARRMGPGYMPMLVFWIQIALGAVVLVASFFNGPDPLERWTGLDAASLAGGVIAFSVVYWFVLPMLTGAPPAGTTEVEAGSQSFLGSGYNGLGIALLVGFLVLAISGGWRPTAFICASLCAFALLLERGGLILATIGTVGVAAFADRSQRVLGVLGCIAVLCLMCWWIFIDQLDIRVPVWPQF
ncbi:hypothetical protein M0638_15670 [Roseomonas sp. NAR14]|uniref:Tripartite tricarboxylate transporter TctB family protein n=1 Tax=Roseomonas acroporae TaxID=2937791 RepID=A0A9X2BUN7_9PROT|nr:tripartite tricarboxylate transporter TctB family protein [Roseomonas acroporae]MCK8785818.1 hypothetical protein [Roseomonas acroporae]